jgi:hypothetical protein
VETTGISLFAFIISGLVTLFAVTRMKDSAGSTLFAVVMNAVTALAGTWYLSMLFGDKIFFQNLYYTRNLQTGNYDLLSLGDRIAATLPLALIIGAAAVYYLSALIICAALCSRSKGHGDE